MTALAEIAAEYPEPGGPMDLLERGEGGPGDRRVVHERQVLPERLPVVALTADLTSDLLDRIDRVFTELATVARSWPSLEDVSSSETRRHREAVVSRSRDTRSPVARDPAALPASPERDDPHPRGTEV